MLSFIYPNGKLLSLTTRIDGKKINCQMWHMTMNPSKDSPHSCKSLVNLFYGRFCIGSYLRVHDININNILIASLTQSL